MQGEIEAAKEILIEGRVKGQKTVTKIIDNQSMNKDNFEIGIEKVENEISGVKKGNPMTFDEADKGNPNPHYEAFTATGDNCQACVPAFMARLNGFDVMAKPFDESNEIITKLSENTSLAWIDKLTGTFPEYIKPKKDYVPLLLDWFKENIADNTYYSFEYYRKYTADGHVMVAFKEKGNFVLYDPQSNEFYRNDAVSLLLYTVRRKTIKLLNISNCNLNKSVLDYVVGGTNMKLNDYIAFSKTHGRDSAKFLTRYNGKSVYIGTRNNNKPRMTGYPLLMTEKKNQIVALTHDEINKVLASMPDNE